MSNNPLEDIRNSIALSPEDREKYQKQGESFFSNFNFEKGEMTSIDETTAEFCKHILAALRSGLSIDELEENDINILTLVHGQNWKNKIFED